MGLLVNGTWVSDDAAGEGVEKSVIDGDKVLVPGNDYVLYIAHACPFAQSAVLALKASEAALDKENISVTVIPTAATGNAEGWFFAEPDPFLGKTQLHQVYSHFDSKYTGRVTVPLLINKTTGKMTSNDSFGIMNLFGAFSQLFPSGSVAQEKLDEIKQLVLSLNFKAYGAGFAKDQAAFDTASAAYFELLAKLDNELDGREFLVPGTTEATGLDLRVVVSLIRFEAVYHYLFKLNRRSLLSYKNIWSYVTRVAQALNGQVAQTFDIDEILRNYYTGLAFQKLNPSGVVPQAPDHVVAVLTQA